jgi:predicted Ser/Thr protein kinase
VNEKTCPICHTPIPGHAPGGLCPACVLRDADEPVSFPAGAPSLEEVAAAFPRLEIIRLIGHGGMGYVYQARQPELERSVALKILSPALRSDPSFEERFSREARVLGKLQHPNIVTLYEHGEAGGFFYLLMEFVDGVNLRQAMSAGRFTPEQALAIVPHICDALQSAHVQGIWHRDIKPENILLDKEGRVKIADFGIARILGDAEKNFTLTFTRSHLGTAAYMAPEQHEKPHDVDHRADIYSLGVVIYEMLTGELPLGRFPAPSERAAVNARVDEIVFRTLEKERELRQQSATQVKTEVEHAGRQAAPGPKPALSRTALLSACLIAVPFLAELIAPVVPGSFSEREMYPTMGHVVAILGVMGATILGWVAVSRIRRSSGRLHGLWLALIGGLFFPLLALDALLTLFYHQLGIAFGWWSLFYSERSNAQLIVYSMLVWPLVDIPLVWWVLSKVRGARDSSSPQEKISRGVKKAALVLACLAIGLVGMLGFSNMIHEKETRLRVPTLEPVISSASKEPEKPGLSQAEASTLKIQIAGGFFEILGVRDCKPGADGDWWSPTGGTTNLSASIHSETSKSPAKPGQKGIEIYLRQMFPAGNYLAKDIMLLAKNSPFENAFIMRLEVPENASEIDYTYMIASGAWHDGDEVHGITKASTDGGVEMEMTHFERHKGDTEYRIVAIDSEGNVHPSWMDVTQTESNQQDQAKTTFHYGGPSAPASEPLLTLESVRRIIRQYRVCTPVLIRGISVKAGHHTRPQMEILTPTTQPTPHDPRVEAVTAAMNEVLEAARNQNSRVFENHLSQSLKEKMNYNPKLNESLAHESLMWHFGVFKTLRLIEVKMVDSMTAEVVLSRTALDKQRFTVQIVLENGFWKMTDLGGL